MLNKITNSDGMALGVCGGVISYCTLLKLATVAQCLGTIAGAVGVVVVLIHRIILLQRDLR